MAPSDHPLKPPEKLKWGHDWKNILLLISGIVGAPVTLFFGSEAGRISGWTAAILVFAAFVGLAYLRWENAALAEIRRFLGESRSKEAPEMIALADGLKRSQLWTRLIAIVFLLAAVASLGLLIGPPLYYKWTTERPKDLSFPDAHYYLPRQDEALMDELPFIPPLITVLKDEGLAEGKNFRIVLGTSRPFPHPTPPVRFSLELKEGKFVLTGFAFRIYRGGRTEIIRVASARILQTEVRFPQSPSLRIAGSSILHRPPYLGRSDGIPRQCSGLDANQARRGEQVMLNRVAIASLAMLSLSFLTQPTRADEPASTKKKVQIEGFVFDSDGKPLSGVDVSVWVAGNADAIASMRTDKEGKYSLKIEVSESFDVSYFLTKYRLAVVTHLAERKDQQISRVLYTRSEKLSVSTAHAALLSQQRIVFLLAVLPKDKRTAFLKNLGAEPDIDEGIPLASGASAEVRELIGEEASSLKRRFKKLSEPR